MKALIPFCFLATLAMYAGAQEKQNFYSFTVTDIDGKTVALSQFRGKKVLVVNVASKCGNTPQYAQLEKLYEKYGPDRFVVIGFPANNFGAQEPGTDAEIKNFCQSTYHVTFPMMSKISVKGDDMAPLYQWLTEKSRNGYLDAPVQWNFQKFLIDEQGDLVGVVPPKTPPDSEKITDWITGNKEKN
jgi:glutathione peroxidase